MSGESVGVLILVSIGFLAGYAFGCVLTHARRIRLLDVWCEEAKLIRNERRAREAEGGGA